MNQSAKNKLAVNQRQRDVLTANGGGPGEGESGEKSGSKRVNVKLQDVSLDDWRLEISNVKPQRAVAQIMLRKSLSNVIFLHR